jgi:hypothetical protein
MSIFGWETMPQAETYTKAARQKILASQGVATIIPVPLQKGGEFRGKNEQNQRPFSKWRPLGDP